MGGERGKDATESIGDPDTGDDAASSGEIETVLDRVTGTPYAAFSRLWAAAILFHIAGNPVNPDIRYDPLGLRVSYMALGLSAAWLLSRPSDRRARISVALATIASLWFEAPFTGNHWLLAAIISIAILIAESRAEPWEWFAPTGRLLLLGFYSFAAFAKLNGGFFDPVEGCARFYTNQALGVFSLPEVGGDVAGVGLASATALIELSVPVLLVMRRTRLYGVMLGVTFHSLLTLDLDQHFYDFSSVLVALFALFLADETLERLGKQDLRPGTQVALLSYALASTALLVVSNESGMWDLVRVTAHVPWLLYAFTVLRRIITGKTRASPSTLRVPSLAAALLVALVVANGVAPYLELKTATGWNMYANLVTVDGESNHFIVRSTYPLGSGHDDLVEVVASNDDSLVDYIDGDWLVPRRNLDAYLARNSGVTVEVVDADGTSLRLTSEGSSSPNEFLDRLLSFRSVDLQDPPRCQSEFLIAR